MIPANELRIGNWIRDKEVGYKDDFQVRAADIVTIALGKTEYHPIPLTPEILEKCGFVYDRMDKEYDIGDDFYIDKQFNVYYKVWEGSDDRGGLEPRSFLKITSLHQLQNLYFALTGTELEYKP